MHQINAMQTNASKAFQSGVSLEQILSACHWKSHNTFTQFYLKDVAWADSKLGTCSGCSVDPPVAQDREEICTYINICAYVNIDTQDPPTDPAISLLGV